jgi:hypothetical protein
MTGQWGPPSSARLASAQGGYPDDLVRLIEWGDGFLFSPQAGVRNGQQLSLSQQNKLFLEHCAAGEQSHAKAIDFLTSDTCNRDVIRMTLRQARPTESVNQEGWTYTIYAPSAEDAEERAAALVHLVDCGVCRPMQQYFLAEGNKRIENSRKQYVEVAKQGAVLRAEEEKLSKPSEISADILSQLKAQKVMVAIELAGLSARVKACDEMLKDPKRLEISTLQSISDMKVKAEVERIGIKEKLDQINAFIGEGDNRQALRQRIGELRGTYDSAAGLAHAYEIEATMMSRLFDLYAPLPLKDNQISISPVEWTN